MGQYQDRVFEVDDLHNRAHVFHGREHAGDILAKQLKQYRETDALVLGIPAGGVPVAARIAEILHLELDVVVAKKISPPQNTEFGYGAVAFDDTVQLNEEILPRLNLSPEDIQQGIEVTRKKVNKRIRYFRADRPFPDVSNRTVILVDDGLATGITFRAAIQALRNQGARQIIGAVPTGHGHSVTDISKVLDALYCANIRTGYSFAVANAYENWYDVPDQEVLQILQQFPTKVI